MQRMPPYDAGFQVGDTVKGKDGLPFVRGGNVMTAKVYGIKIYNCPMEGPEWMAYTSAGNYLTPGLERV